MPPTAEHERLPLLDALRGLALLGIGVINVRYLALPMREVFGGFPAERGTEVADVLGWYLGSLLFEDRMIALFSTLFGAGVAIYGMRGGWGRQVRGLWRNLLLLGLGVWHAHLLWHGDVLMVYGLCGIALVLLQAWRWPVWLLLPLGVGLCLAAPLWRSLPEDLERLRAGPAPAEAPAEASAEVDPEVDPETDPETDRTPRALAPLPDARQRSATGWGVVIGNEAETHGALPEGAGARARAAAFARLVRWRVATDTWWHVVGGTYNVLRCGGFMLIGMALLQLGLLAGRWSAGAGATLFLVAGLLCLVGTWMQDRAGLIALVTGVAEPDEVVRGRAGLERLSGYLAAGAGMLAWVGLLAWACRSRTVVGLLTPLRAVGRTALSCYLGQSLVLTFAVHPWGLGWWGELGVVEQLELIGLVAGAQLVLATLWLRAFRFGPVEWLWRSATWLRWQPLLRTARPGPDGDGA